MAKAYEKEKAEWLLRVEQAHGILMVFEREGVRFLRCLAYCDTECAIGCG